MTDQEKIAWLEKELEAVRKEAGMQTAEQWEELVASRELLWEQDEEMFLKMREERRMVARSAEHNTWLQDRQIRKLKAENTTMREQLRHWWKIIKSLHQKALLQESV